MITIWGGKNLMFQLKVIITSYGNYLKTFKYSCYIEYKVVAGAELTHAEIAWDKNR